MTSKVHHGKLLRQLLEHHQLDVPSFFELLKDEISSISTVYKLLESEEISKARLCLFCAMFNVGPAYFHKPDNYFDPVAALANKANSSDRLVLYNYIGERKSNYVEFVDAYFQAFTNHMLTAQRSIYVLDYLASKSGVRLQDPIGYFHQANSTYFQKLQAHLTSGSYPIDYRRVCQLPIGTIIDQDGITDEETLFQRKIEVVIESLFEETFEHFCYCYKYCNDHFKLYVVQHPIRLYSYYIADENCILSKYFRFDIKGLPVPDILFINKIGYPRQDSSAKFLIENYTQELRKLWEESTRLGRKQVTKDLFYLCTLKRAKAIELELQTRQKELEIIENNFTRLLELLVINDMGNADSEEVQEIRRDKLRLETDILELQRVHANMQAKCTLLKQYFA
ncbi:MAG TPA: hypothetical protein PKE68_06615 [Saprospiraceae bacterium]|nr:hypothetical protein [Saprospiraceae bacterium]